MLDRVRGCCGAGARAGGYLSSTSTAPPTEWIIEEPDRDLGTLAVGTHTVEWRVTNRADSERSILGVAEG